MYSIVVGVRSVTHFFSSDMLLLSSFHFYLDFYLALPLRFASSFRFGVFLRARSVYMTRRIVNYTCPKVRKNIQELAVYKENGVEKHV